MPLTKKKLDDLWRSGYCRATVEHARNTDDTQAGAEERVAFMTLHVKECEDCGHANVWKGVELRIAERLGPKAREEFFQGLGPERYPGYKRHLRDILNERADELETPEIQSWLRRITARGPYKRRWHGGTKTKEHLN
jgi:hypothetical protein